MIRKQTPERPSANTTEQPYKKYKQKSHSNSTDRGIVNLRR
jgi:hypothetical protein